MEASGVAERTYEASAFLPESPTGNSGNRSSDHHLGMVREASWPYNAYPWIWVPVRRPQGTSSFRRILADLNEAAGAAAVGAFVDASG